MRRLVRAYARPIGPLTPRERWSFDVHGYVVRRAALTPAEVRVLDVAVDALGLAVSGPALASQRFRDHLHTHPAFVALLDHPAVLDVLVELCGRMLRLD